MKGLIVVCKCWTS